MLMYNKQRIYCEYKINKTISEFKLILYVAYVVESPFLYWYTSGVIEDELFYGTCFKL